MAAMDKKLQEAKKNIAELEAGVIFNVMKNEMEAKESQSEPQAFNGEYTRWRRINWVVTMQLIRLLCSHELKLCSRNASRDKGGERTRVGITFH